MDVTSYCKQAIGKLRESPEGRAADHGAYQRIIVLSSFGGQDFSPRDFTTALTLLIESSERSGRRKVAEAADMILRDWQSASVPG